MTLRRANAIAAAALIVSCSSPSTPNRPPSPASAAPAPAPAPAPSTAAPSPAPPNAASCRFGFGTLDTACARRTQQLEGDVGAAIDRLAEHHPEYFDTSINPGTGEWRVLRPADYLAGVVDELRQWRFCAETDEVATVSVRNGSEFSETYDVLLPTGNVRRGNRVYVETCSPPSFPVVASEAIAYVRVAFYGIACEDGITAPRNGANVLPIGCRGFVTATPKQRNNEDVPRAIVGSDISWRIEQGGERVVVHDDPHNDFNKTVVALNAGPYALCATSHGVEGCQYAEVVPDPRR